MIDLLDAAFAPLGQTVLIAAPTVTPPLGVQVLGTGVNKDKVVGIRIYNDGANAAFVGYGATGVAAQNNSVVPTGGTPQTCIPIPSKSAVALTVPLGTFFSGIALVATANLYLTPGIGLD